MIKKILPDTLFYTFLIYVLFNFNFTAIAQTIENKNWETINNFTDSSIQSPNEPNSSVMTDEEFFNAINSLENTTELLKQPLTSTIKSDTVRFYNEFFSSNRKPGYLLFSNENNTYDYKLTGYSSKIKYYTNYNLSIEGGYYKNFITENESEQVSLQKINLLLSGKPFSNLNVTGNARQIKLSSNNAFNEYEFGLSSSIKNFQVEFGTSKNIYTGDSSSYSDPPEYYRFNLRTGYELSSEYYLEVMPAFESYLKNINKKREISASLLYMPDAFPKLSLNVYSILFKFENERDASGNKYAYFSPGLSRNSGIGMNYLIDITKKSRLNLGLNLEKEKYYFDDEPTEYYMLSTISGLNIRVKQYMNLNMTYGFSISQSNGFPLTQNFRLNTEIKF